MFFSCPLNKTVSISFSIINECFIKFKFSKLFFICFYVQSTPLTKHTYIKFQFFAAGHKMKIRTMV